MSEKLIANFDGGYGRKGTVKVIDSVCDVCRKETRVISIDASDEEYAPGNICLDCAKKALS